MPGAALGCFLDPFPTLLNGLESCCLQELIKLRILLTPLQQSLAGNIARLRTKMKRQARFGGFQDAGNLASRSGTKPFGWLLRRSSAQST